MIFYQQETLIGLVIASLPAILSAYFFFYTDKKSTALGLLLLSALLLRLLMISLDPFLHAWDEHFHALVAKNMMEHPFKPMLFANPIVAHDSKDWSYCHIWLHKQPLFLWQMAISMKLFGINELAMRLPSAIMSAIGVLLTYDIARLWTKNLNVAFFSAILSCFSYYMLELVSGKLSLEHNDIAFIFYVTLSLWCFLKYINSDDRVKWAVCTGIAVGCAILNKWLTGFLVFGGWGLYLLTTHGKHIRFRYILHLLLALLVSVIIFLPWQIYISKTFPLESALEYRHNTEHFFKDFGHPQSWNYHFMLLPEAYHLLLIPFLLLGLGAIFSSRQIDKKTSLSMISMAVVIYLFFSLLVATKMPSFTFSISPVIFILISYGLFKTFDFIAQKMKLGKRLVKASYCLIVILASCLVAKPIEIIENRDSGNEIRNKRIHNTAIIKEINDTIAAEYTILNFREYENIDFMFYKKGTGYHFYPDSIAIDTMISNGHTIGALDYTDHQKLPGYITSNPKILILSEKFD